MNFADPQLWLGLVIGAILWFVIQNRVIPDPISLKMADSENFPNYVVLPLGILLLVVVILNLLAIAGIGAVTALFTATYEPWLAYILITGIVLVVGWYIYRRRHP